MIETAKTKIDIFDTTLRDGTQCPGAGIDFAHSLEYARLAHGLGVNILEAGFPAASRLDFEIVSAIAKELAAQPGSPVIAALCQLRSEQVDRTIDALLPAVPYGNARLHTYVPVDPELMKASLGSRAQDYDGILKDTYEFVLRAVRQGLQVEFSPEGYSCQGDNFGFVTDLIRAAVSAGATVINCPDTRGSAIMYQRDTYFVRLMERHAEIIYREFPSSNVIWSTHCHNDHGLAVANSIEAIRSVARQVEGTINGVGERAGNGSLEQVIMLIKKFGDQINPDSPFFTTIVTEKLQSISDFVAQHVLPRQPHSPITGENASKHTSGGHTNAVLKNPTVYQAFDPREVGSEVTLVFGPLSGGNHVQIILRQAGYLCTNDEKQKVAQFVKDYYVDRRKGVTDQEVVEAYKIYRAPIAISSFGYSKLEGKAVAALRGKFFNAEGSFEFSLPGNDSPLAALQVEIGKYLPGIEFQDFEAGSAGSGGVHATGASRIRVKYNGLVYQGEGSDKDIEISAMKALIDGVNQAYIESKFRVNTI